MKKAFSLIEMIIGLSIICLIMTVGLLGYKEILFSMSLDNESILLKKYLEQSREFAYSYKTKVYWTLEPESYELKTEAGEVLKKHTIPRRISVNGKPFHFTVNLTPSEGQTIILQLDKKQKKIIIDPVTGRIRMI
ncbi:MAG: prepilin-type N-terminal cleavage/methylation domain-containing protein [Candidatus Margulisbacteria bacterium]|nr:prepilin-type N-terminal cleavage/methylation domain-containing protein [Candidatus Margulisiibacteriota bacterium]